MNVGFRVSLRTLLLVTAYVALVVTALAQGTIAWANAVHNITVLGLLYGTLGALCSRGEERPGWIGFAVSGWLYLFLAFGPTLTGPASELLATQELLRPFQPSLAEHYAKQLAPEGLQTRGDLNGEEFHYLLVEGRFTPYGIWDKAWKQTLLLGHSIWALLFALAGSIVARRFAMLSQPRVSPVPG